MIRTARPSVLAVIVLLAAAACQRKQADAEPEAEPRCSVDADCGSGLACLSGACVPAFNITGEASSAPPASVSAEVPFPSGAPVASASAPPARSAVPILSGNPSAQTLAQRAEALDLKAIGALATGTSAPSAAPSAGTPRLVEGPEGSASVGAVSVTGGKVEGASRVVAGLRTGFRRCYDRGLQENPSQKGAIQFDAGVGAKGEVIRVIAVPSGTISASVVQCAQTRVQSARFAAPSRLPASVRFKVSLSSK